MRLPAAVLATAVAVMTACATCLVPTMFPAAVKAVSSFGPLAPPNPFMAPNGLASMHNDAGSADAGPLPGPGAGLQPIFAYPLLAACPTITQGTDGLVLALCTTIADQSPIVHLLDPGGVLPQPVPLASLGIAKGGLLGGVYAYLDNNNQLVMIDGTNHLLRIAHVKDAKGCWQLVITEATDVSSVIPPGDSSVGVVPDYLGNVWFATATGVVGVAKAGGGGVASVQLNAGEQVANSISSSPTNRVAIASTHALYEVNLDGMGNPQILWRQAYDRGPARKPGQLSWGTGSTPTYFGPTGADYLTIVDNAEPIVHAVVRESGTGNLICEQPVLTQGGPGSENSPIGVGSTMFIASTYGYPYPAVPPNAGPAVPPTAPFVGGMTRVDVDNPGCHTVWDNRVRSAALPHLSIGDGLIYTITRLGLDNTTPLDGFAFAVVDPNNGRLLLQQPKSLTLLSDPIQTASMVLMNNKIMQGNITGIGRIG
ncbi:hypothetical protein [Mycobacterium bourgelatii]|uniref:Uncharacterized protein n=1 Tax=Mycobacterium bourgelatii TaxID=1273442 RepID=A0A7I9YWC6_MYCBU|nr:hypothetical protein [Mycobacterium bourgelatii]MCV6978255.1 hypothetical protein [Mycobacterium bourgelatii]GFG93001.1 hypothetical protein MBOU_50430 [Mycobacterium bourgelatii]